VKEDRLRLAVDAANFAADRRGMGRYARAIAQAALADPTIDVTLLARKREQAGLRAVFGLENFVLKTPGSARRRRRFDAAWFPWNGMRFRPAAPALVMIHDCFAFTEPARGFVARRREQVPIRKAARDAAVITTPSQFSADEIVRVLHVERERIFVVPLAPDSFFSPGEGKDALPPVLSEKRYVLLVGGREARKNIRMILEAAARSLDAASERLVIVGELSRLDEVRLRAYGVPNVRLRAGDEQLRALYRHASVVVVPSTTEGFGLVAAEAMACGAPVVASNAAALPEVCGDAAILLDPHDMRLWAQTLRELLDHEPRRLQLSAQSTARWAFAERDTFVHRTIELLRGLA